jgi:sugar-specific transcriptional regulator TrmB
MDLKEILESTGMGKYKSEAYMGLLKIRTGTIQQIAKSCKVPSCKLYECMKWLHENGYATLVSENPLAYRANDPKESIINDVSENIKRLEDIKTRAKEIKLDIPPLEKGIIQLTTTRKGYFEKMKECARRAEKYMHYIAKNWKYDAELLRLRKQKIEQGVELKALGPVNKKTRRAVNIMRKIGIQVRNFEPRGLRFAVYDGKTVIISLRKQEERKEDYPAAYIESDALAEILESKFQEIWKSR